MNKVLKAETRAQLTKGANNRLRKAGKIPGIVYGHEEPVAVSVDARDFANNFKRISESEIITLSVGAKERKVLIKDYQRNALRGEITHLDFYEIEKGHKLRTHVPIRISGTAPGLKEGGILENSLHEFEVECLSELLPEFITVDVSDLSSGHAIHVRDIKVPQGLKILNSQDQVVASITHAKVVAEPVATEEVPAPVAAPAAAKPATAKKE